MEIQTSNTCIWIEDTSGDLELDRLRPVSYTLANGIIVCFSMESKSSFLAIEDRASFDDLTL